MWATVNLSGKYHMCCLAFNTGRSKVLRTGTITVVLSHLEGPRVELVRI